MHAHLCCFSTVVDNRKQRDALGPQNGFESVHSLLNRVMARLAAEGGDEGTNDLIVSDVIRRNELQVWFVAEHVVDSPLTQAV